MLRQTKQYCVTMKYNFDICVEVRTQDCHSGGDGISITPSLTPTCDLCLSYLLNLDMSRPILPLCKAL